mmetsp:Transcript_37122/g.106953  ORF Transcript_37122/g.106953 Transcript_37122/m.106953 type:complete len:221 (+) Transcript_37122:1561-2223(+)
MLTSTRGSDGRCQTWAAAWRSSTEHWVRRLRTPRGRWRRGGWRWRRPSRRNARIVPASPMSSGPSSRPSGREPPWCLTPRRRTQWTRNTTSGMMRAPARNLTRSSSATRRTSTRSTRWSARPWATRWACARRSARSGTTAAASCRRPGSSWSGSRGSSTPCRRSCSRPRLWPARGSMAARRPPSGRSRPRPPPRRRQVWRRGRCDGTPVSRLSGMSSRRG